MAPATRHLAVVLQATDEVVAEWTTEHRQQCLARQVEGAETCAERRRRALGEVTRWLREEAVELDWAHAVASAVRLGTWMACDPDPDPRRGAADEAIIAYAKHDPLTEVARDGRYQRPQVGYEMSRISMSKSSSGASECQAAITFAAALGDARRELQAWPCAIAFAVIGVAELKALGSGPRLEAQLARVRAEDQFRAPVEIIHAALALEKGRGDEAVGRLQSLIQRSPRTRRGHMYRAEAASVLVRAHTYSNKPRPIYDEVLSAVMHSEQSYGPMHPKTLMAVVKAGAYFEGKQDADRLYDDAAHVERLPGDGEGRESQASRHRPQASRFEAAARRSTSSLQPGERGFAIPRCGCGCGGSTANICSPWRATRSCCRWLPRHSASAWNRRRPRHG